MRQLHNILSNPETTEEQKEHIRSFMTYVVGMAAGDMLKSGEQALDWRPGALISGNAVHEHCLEVYLSWMLSSDDPNEIFTNAAGQEAPTSISWGGMPDLAAYYNLNSRKIISEPLDHLGLK
jgi:hypothetical protein